MKNVHLPPQIRPIQVKAVKDYPGPTAEKDYLQYSNYDIIIVLDKRLALKKKIKKITLLLVHVRIILIYVMSCICPAGRPAFVSGKNFNIGHYTHTFQSDCFIPAMLIGTIDIPF